MLYCLSTISGKNLIAEKSESGAWLADSELLPMRNPTGGEVDWFFRPLAQFGDHRAVEILPEHVTFSYPASKEVIENYRNFKNELVKQRSGLILG